MTPVDHRGYKIAQTFFGNGHFLLGILQFLGYHHYFRTRSRQSAEHVKPICGYNHKRLENNMHLKHT